MNGWESYIGQAEVVAKLRRFQAAPPTAPVLLCGPAGTGRNQAAGVLAGALAEEPVLDLRGRLLVMDRNAPRDEEDERYSVHALRRALSLRAVARRAVVLDLHGASAEVQNSLLKLLEEPPADTHLLLVAEVGDVLVTVRSRCLLVPFRLLDHDELRGVAERLGWPIDDHLLGLAGGSADRLHWLSQHPEAVQALQRRDRDALVGSFKASEAPRDWLRHALPLLPASAAARVEAQRMLVEGVRPEACLVRALLEG